ncbi:BRCT domain-containing protein [Striga hermonthica]|uniref:BRCT domain-containing protein n=1 Tax=Striga hermonthica TaxID=68872 RepID=A0A9N7NJN6_STRHE|nr:BRCT domain-containing protein [Striga hermonthica]
MQSSKQVVAYDDPSKTFFGVCFVLLGFDPVKGDKVRLKLLEGGGIDAVSYGPNCTHAIVDKLTYDDPICIAARSDGKAVVNALWVDHSFDVGMPVDPSSVMYRPMKDLNGITGAKSLVVCLTGYQRQDRDDIMNMVALMGASFSKPLVANKVTHLICYKFEGEKYELAKKLKRIKLVNHRWLEDCLKAWELLPESDYDKSGYELEMMAEAKDSEEETEDMATAVDFGRKIVVGPQNTLAENRSFQHSPAKLETSQNSLQRPIASTVLENAGTISNKIHSSPRQDIHEEHLKLLSPFCAKSPGKFSPRVLSNTLHCTSISDKVDNVIAPVAEMDKKSPDVDMSILSCRSNCKFTPSKHSSSVRLENIQQISPRNANNFGGSDGFHIDYGVETPPKESLPAHEEFQTAKTLNKSKATVSRGGSKSPSLDLCIDREVKTPLMGTHDASQTAKLPDKREKSPSLNLCIDREVQTPLMGTHDACQTAKSPDKREKSPSLNLCIDREVKTPLMGTCDASQTAKSPHKSEKSVLKSPILSHDAKMAMVSELATNSLDHLSGLACDIPQKAVAGRFSRMEASSAAPKESLNTSLRGQKKQIMTSSDVKDLSSTHCDVQDIEPPVAKPNSGIETMDGQDDLNGTLEGNTMPPQTKVVKRKLLAKKTLGSRRSIGKGSSSKLKGTLNLQKAILNNESVAHSKRAILMEVTDDATVDDETKAENEEVEAPHFRKHDINSEKEACSKIPPMDENGTGAELPEVKDKSECREKKISKGKKRPLVNSKTSKSKDSGDGVKKDKDEKKSGSASEETVLLAGKTKKRPSKKLKSSGNIEKENDPDAIKLQSGSEKLPEKDFKTVSCVNGGKGADNKLEQKAEPAWFILSGHRLQRKDFQQLIRRLKGRVCRDSHNWSYQATHFVVPDPVKRTEKFFAAAASGRWILKTDYLTACNEAGRFLPEEPYEWHKKCLTEDGAINLEAPRKWRLLKEKTGHGAFYGMQIVIYGECIAPPLDTLKRVIKAGDGTILATSPPYTRFLQSGIDFAIVSPGMPRVDMWVQEFLNHEVPCVVADYLVEYVCKPGYPLEKHVQYNTHSWAKKSLENLTRRLDEVVEDDVRTPPNLCIDDVACRECGSRDRAEEMLICGDESGSLGCGVGVHLDCLDPPLCSVPEEDWFCTECAPKTKRGSSRKKALAEPGLKSTYGERESASGERMEQYCRRASASARAVQEKESRENSDRSIKWRIMQKCGSQKVKKAKQLGIRIMAKS